MLVVARANDAGSIGLLWALMITSSAHRRRLGDVEIVDIAGAGLPAPSMVRTAKIATIEADDAVRIGCLPASERRAMRMQIAKMLASALDASG